MEPEPFMKRSTEHDGPEDSTAGTRRQFHSWPRNRYEEILQSFVEYLEKNGDMLMPIRKRQSLQILIQY
jgi:hypothetical protein